MQFTASGYATVRQGNCKYVYHCVIDAEHPAQRELYNLVSDPSELHHLASSQQHIARMVTMHQALVRELGQDPDHIEQRSRSDLVKGYHRVDPKPNQQAGPDG